MDENDTTASIQRYLDELANLESDSPVEPVVSTLLARSAQRLHMLCASVLYRSYPRLTKPPFSIEAEDLLGAVAERMIKALRQARPQTVRQFFAMTNQHIRWEMNSIARRLDEQAKNVELNSALAPSQESSGAELTPNARRILEAIENLSDEEREVFSLIRIQGMTHSEAAAILGVSTKTIQRRLNLSLVLLTETLGDLRPSLSKHEER